MLGFRVRLVAPALHAADFSVRKAFAKDFVAHQVQVGCVHAGFVFDFATEIVQNPRGALVCNMRLRRFGQSTVAVHNHVLDPV